MRQREYVDGALYERKLEMRTESTSANVAHIKVPNQSKCIVGRLDLEGLATRPRATHAIVRAQSSA